MSVEERWRGRPKLALALKTLIVTLPLAASVVVSLFAASRLPSPDGALQATLWWLALMVISVIVLIAGEAIARRFLPLVALLRLSLLFPGPAPSRVGIARASTRAELRRLTARVEREGLGTDLATVARTLVILVGALDVHDRSTRGHSERVRLYTDMLAERLGLDEPDRDRLRWAALLHDLGKLRIPLHVLNKRSALTEDDWALIHKHPEDGEKMLGPLREWLGEWALVVRHHHEWWNGEGYPDQLAGERIPLGARVVAIADSYDVMTSIRSYQQRARSAGAAREELVQCAGTQFDPALVRRFLGLSTRRLWLLLGPLSWVAQLPVVGPVLAEAAVVTTGQAVVVLGAASVVHGGPADFAESQESADEDDGDPADTTPEPTVGTDAIGTAPGTGLDTVPATAPPGATDTSTTVPAASSTTAVPGAPTSSIFVVVTAPTTSNSVSPTSSSTSAPAATLPPATAAPPPPAPLRACDATPGPTTATTTTTTTGTTTGTTLGTGATTTTDPGAPPEASADEAVVPAGDRIVIDVLGNDSDPDGDLDAGSLALETAPGKGRVSVVDGRLVYTADANASGVDRFVYTVLDEAGACAEAPVSITIR